jgi:hypothetical protein
VCWFVGDHKEGDVAVEIPAGGSHGGMCSGLQSTGLQETVFLWESTNSLCRINSPGAETLGTIHSKTQGAKSNSLLAIA